MPTLTCDELAATWPIKWPRPDPMSNRRHALAVKRFGKAFKFRPIDSIRPEEARFFAEVNPGHVRYLVTMFNDAIGDGLMGAGDPQDLNPFVGLRLPKVVKGRKRPRVPTVEELAALEAAAEQHWIRDALTFSAYTGVRQGECRAFSLDDLDGVSRETVGSPIPSRAAIDWQLTPDERLKIPKKESRRRIFLPGPARLALIRRRDTPRRDGGPWLAGPVVRKPRPRRFWAIDVRKWGREWTAIRKAAGVQIRWHDLRHHAATWFLDHGASVPDVAVQLGCTVLEVERTYGHPDPEKSLTRLEGLVE